MPYYQFNCSHCGKNFELEFKMSEVGKKSPKCPGCGKKLSRVFSFSSQANKIKEAKIKSSPSCTTGTCPFVN
jgi:putative FmdB family regulatory protein